MREDDSFLNRLEETLSRMSAWISARRRGGEQATAHRDHARIEALRRDIGEARRGLLEAGRADLGRVRTGLDDLERDYDFAFPHTALTRAELEAFRRHVQTTARLMRDHSNLDSPNWNEAHEAYERSWADVERAYSEGASASPP